MLSAPAQFHLGCGEERIDGFVNIDVRATAATDRVLDLGRIRPEDVKPAACFFSHAFFEHLPRGAQIHHLAALREALIPGGFVCYLGLPDFESVARLYLDRGPGVIGPTFDLYNVYRYTHGDPEGVEGWYFEQLHKSLFDAESVNRLLRDSEFGSWSIFRYVYPGEGVALNLGFYASPARVGGGQLNADALEFLGQFDGRLLELDTVEYAGAGKQSRAVAAIRQSSGARLLQRISWGAAVRLARIGRVDAAR